MKDAFTFLIIGVLLTVIFSLVIKNYIFKLSNVSFKDRFWLSLLFIFITINFYLLADNLSNNKLDIKALIFLFVALFTSLLAIYLFHKKVNNDDFTILVGICIFMQSAISMSISNNYSENFLVHFVHSLMYIGLPAFLFYEINNKKKDKTSELEHFNFTKKDGDDAVRFIFKLVDTFKDRETQ
ncbi:hypothetical protein QV08_03985 [Gallibacterium salpingitidis]|uniref:Uncharacterized protein n=1 Tax=Gallibacterium salpingitidis TaxID=505341 RepID=A0AB36E102_9PAST|nr:hypothetical protein [Gallibacterium salpingitidis]OBX08609.1 hypothetical protein QV08_03985 [Gallibacterium salpingitidis]OBX08969.1 hypothetical protein QV09_08835 [Gallibacterium salpingitidis]WKS98823.1 hypothetical protein NYR30_08615 [Gallibacterium salpingitidis]